MKFLLLALEEDNIQRTAQLLQKYADTRLDFVDATIVAAAERLTVSRVLTLDHRDFRLVPPRHVESFELLPVLT
ncbi:MAG: hypothetical protein HXY41_17575 [Chloroflexi bacterium]|nr:hypothetical protein [Chloroflexota bacterium]